MVRVGVDLMGADTAPHMLFQGVLAAARQLPPSHALVVYATKDVSSEIASQCHTSQSNASIECVVVGDFIAMEDSPVAAIKSKKTSSLVTGMHALAQHEIDAFVSCGNTGAVVAGAVILLKKFPRILRPGLVATLPSKKGPVVVIDVGGTATAQARHLLQFAHLGVAYHAAVYRTAKPKVGLLNIGVESKKGRGEIRETYRRLEELAEQSRGRWAFSGNIEGRDVFSGDVDVVVTDGFTGNVMVKTAEGTAAFVMDMISRTKDAASMGILSSFGEDRHAGALLCGVEDVVIKVHGNASAEALCQGICKASSCIEKKIVPLIKSFLL